MTGWRIVPRGGQRDTLGEGTVWSAREGALYWVDILAPALNRLVLATGNVTRWPMPEPLGWVVERTGGGFIAGLQSGFAELDLDPVRIRPIADPEPHLPGNRMNDGKADAHGAIWCGTMDMAEAADTGALYRFGPDRQIGRADSGYGVPNGPAFSTDGRWLYHSDTARRTVFRFPRLDAARLGARETFITFAEEDGHPDGMTVDAQDHLWIAHWGGSRVSRFRPDGTLDRAIALPARQITNLAFCGDALDRLIVSSAAIGLPDSDVDGALFEVDAGVRGCAPGLFAG
ncbi:SMP-30/gluconolactonase/LRE family protein [Sphingomonas jatrophae]|uniref:Sugar lactone lactonase YvrE n=1 Tax=Sphingomonas jatrophae TaxID=1166337 RepID=A0A1I6JTT0_9SPHN|nr:SMP-30/gluconolactonase/LRE family protein [Sphingomonas jatrophae]SFR82366.1 Sugar lactone lactonase YvrE [Sphingomonas jatrophae]